MKKPLLLNIDQIDEDDKNSELKPQKSMDLTPRRFTPLHAGKSMQSAKSKSRGNALK